MAALNLSKPVLFTIKAYLDSKHLRPVRPAPHQMKARYDLSSIKISEENEFENDQGVSTDSAKATFYASKSRTLSVKLFFSDIDLGSYGLADLRANASRLLKASSQLPVTNSDSISSQVALFERLCQAINGHSHEPSYLRLNWVKAGLKTSWDARLKSFEINYTLFGHDGTPLLAELDAIFIETVEPKKQQARNRLSSPDLSHRHLVLAGETLPMLCLQYYGTTAPYLQVAAFNQLDNFVFLEAGSHLLFPPLVAQGGDD